MNQKINEIPTGEPKIKKQINGFDSVSKSVENLLIITQEAFTQDCYDQKDFERIIKNKSSEFFELVISTGLKVHGLLLLSFYLDRVVRYQNSREINFMLLLINELKKPLLLTGDQRREIYDLFISDHYFEEIYKITQK